MPVQAIRQAECTECDDEEAEFKSIERDMDVEKSVIARRVRCDNCKNTAIIRIDSEGINATDGISYENATWNNVEEEEDSDD